MQEQFRRQDDLAYGCGRGYRRRALDGFASRSEDLEPTAYPCPVLLKEFYADPQRAQSEEVDFGSNWRAQGEGPWKVVWMRATGEVVAFHESAFRSWEPSGVGGGGGGDGNFFVDMAVGVVFEAAVEGVIGLFRHGAPKPRPQLDEVVVIGVEPDLMRVRGALLGWEPQMPEENGLAWLAERVDELTGGQAGGTSLHYRD